MHFLASACLLALHGLSGWSSEPQPASTKLRTATILSDGRWFGTDTSYKSWISRDRGATWTSFANAEGDPYAWDFGMGVVVGTPDDENSFFDRYDVSSGTWRPMVFDRKLVGTDTSVKQTGSRWQHKAAGTYLLAIFRSDSVLAFRSEDSARSWKSIATVASSEVPGGAKQNSGFFAGGRFWLTDTGKKVFRSPDGGGKWLQVAFPTNAGAECQIMDSTLAAGWIAIVANQGKLSALSTKDLGKTWEAYDLSSPESLPNVRISMPGGWEVGVGFRSDTSLTFARKDGGTWVEMPLGAGQSVHLSFIDAGRIYAIGEAGLVSMDLKEWTEVSNRPRAVRSGLRWSWQGTSLKVSGAKPGEVWQLRDSRGRILGVSRSDALGAIRFDAPRGAKGILFLVAAGSSAWSEPILAP